MLKKTMHLFVCLCCFIVCKAQVTTNSGTGASTTQNSSGDVAWTIESVDASSATDANESTFSGLAGASVASHTLLIESFSLASFPATDAVQSAEVNIDMDEFSGLGLTISYTCRVIRIDGGETTLLDLTSTHGLTILGISTINCDENSGWSLNGLTGADLNNSSFRIEFEIEVPIGVDFDFGVDRVELQFTTSAPLPVEWKPLEASPEEGLVQLTWGTYTESNNAFFAIERSVNAYQWTQIGQVAGKGTTYLEQSYSFTDHNPNTPISYYRIKQVDYDATYEYSAVRSVFIEEVQVQHPVINSLGRDQLWIDVGSRSAVQMQVVNPLGQVNFRKELGAGSHTLPIPAPVSGIYFVLLLEKNTGRKWSRSCYLQRTY